MDDTRPNPDVLLSRVTSEENRQNRGRFHLFFGMAAGVGKTFSMLQAAQGRLKEGVDVCVGVVETHGRKETEKLSEGLTVIPRKKIEYRGTAQEEMDLDAILAKKPQLVLVDELAHTNIPGSRHEKRYQDVIEILEAGIDVYSTMNVQHLESRADVVGLITAVNVRETVPDSVLDLADQIELIDITPHELIDRLKEGKIYPGRKTEQALQYFFQEGNLSALREIALRATADKVERDLREARPATLISATSAPTEKLLVAVSHSPFSERLIRTARRLTDDLEIPWVAVHVDSGGVLSAADQNQLVKNLDLATEMGAETVTLHGTDVVAAISDYAQQNNVVQMIVGRPGKSGRWWSRPSQHVEQLIRRNPSIDVTVLQQPDVLARAAKGERGAEKLFKWHWSPFMKVTGWVALASAVNYLVGEYVGYRAVGFLYLLLIIILSAVMPFSAVFLAATLSALIWDYFFIPPHYTFLINAPEDVMLVVAYFVIACVSGFLTYQIKRNQKILRDREERTRALYDVLKSMTLVQGTQAIISFAIAKIEKLFDAQCSVLLARDGHLSASPDFGSKDLSENDRAVAAWSFDHGRMAGWSTDTLPLSRVFCLALKSGSLKLGVLVFRPKTDKKLNPDQVNLLISITNQIGMVLAKQRYDDDVRQASLLRESERLHETLLNCISHELRTPLTAIMGAATTLQTQTLEKKEDKTLQILSGEIVSASERLNHVFENLLDVTRLESGGVKLNKEWFDLTELVQFAMDRQSKLLVNHPVTFHPPQDAVYFLGDYSLLAHALSNLLLNAATYSPEKSAVDVAIRREGDHTIVSISDKGSGIPEKYIPNVFDKFFRVPGTPTGGMGLGLSITKNLVELHGGTVEARNNIAGGATFSVILPYAPPPAQIVKAGG